MDRLQVGWWWRFARYEIHNHVICPVAESMCAEYDPWVLFERAREATTRPMTGKRLMEPPFQDLFALAHQIRDPFGCDANLIARWCSRFGLLGILPHCAHTITLPARWAGKAGNAADQIWRGLHRLKPNQLVPTVTQHFRTPTGWRSIKMPFPPVREVEGVAGEIVDDKDLPFACPRPGVIWTKAGEANPSAEPLEVLKPFFDSKVADHSKYPMPLSTEFWGGYREPVHEFWNAALAFYVSAKAIARLRHKPLTELQNTEAALLFRDFERLNALASPVCVSLGPAWDGSNVVQRWAGPSLLSSLAHMALLTLSQGQVLCCKRCDGVFVSKAWQAKYCSPTCRDTMLKRALRHRQKTAVTMRRDGEPVKNIARKLGSTEQTVREWLRKSRE